MFASVLGISVLLQSGPNPLFSRHMYIFTIQKANGSFGILFRDYSRVFLSRGVKMGGFLPKWVEIYPFSELSLKGTEIPSD